MLGDISYHKATLQSEGTQHIQSIQIQIRDSLLESQNFAKKSCGTEVIEFSQKLLRGSMQTRAKF